MRLTHAALVGAAVLAAAATPAAASATSISINAQPRTIVAGDPVVIYGTLTAPVKADQPVVLHHRLAGSPAFSVIQTVDTDASGNYEFTRLPNVVNSNRAWYVTSDGARSKKVHELVESLVTLSGPSATTLLTGPAHPYTFTGTVAPFVAGTQVLLQRQSASGGATWATIQKGVVAPDGTITINHVFSVPGDASLRVLVKGDGDNVQSPSSPLEYEIEQAENPVLTINGSTLPLPFGQSETISGVLANGGGKIVTLFSSTDDTSYVRAAEVTAGIGGVYSFTETPVNSTFYKVSGGSKHSARLFVGVKDQLTLTSISDTTIAAGGSVTFAGTVAPDKTNHVIYLERKNASGLGFHVIQTDTVGANSTFSITRTFVDAGTKIVRVEIPGGPENSGDTSAPTTITVTAAPLS